MLSLIAGVPDENLPPSLIAWRDRKLVDLSYCLAIFFNYLALPRSGYSRVVVNPDVDIMSVRPVISMEMVNYLIREIYPCSAMLQDGGVYKVPDAIARAIERTIREYIANKELLIQPAKKKKDDARLNNNFYIEDVVYQAIWTYLSNGMESLASSPDELSMAELEPLVRSGSRPPKN